MNEPRAPIPVQPFQNLPRLYSAPRLQSVRSGLQDVQKWQMSKRSRVIELWASGLDQFEIAYLVCGLSSDQITKLVEDMVEEVGNAE